MSKLLMFTGHSTPGATPPPGSTPTPTATPAPIGPTFDTIGITTNGTTTQAAIGWWYDTAVDNTIIYVASAAGLLQIPDGETGAVCTATQYYDSYGGGGSRALSVTGVASFPTSNVLGLCGYNSFENFVFAGWGTGPSLYQVMGGGGSESSSGGTPNGIVSNCFIDNAGNVCFAAVDISTHTIALFALPGWQVQFVNVLLATGTTAIQGLYVGYYATAEYVYFTYTTSNDDAALVCYSVTQAKVLWSKTLTPADTTNNPVVVSSALVVDPSGNVTVAMVEGGAACHLVQFSPAGVLNWQLITSRAIGGPCVICGDSAGTIYVFGTTPSGGTNSPSYGATYSAGGQLTAYFSMSQPAQTCAYNTVTGELYIGFAYNSDVYVACIPAASLGAIDGEGAGGWSVNGLTIAQSAPGGTIGSTLAVSNTGNLPPAQTATYTIRAVNVSYVLAEASFLNQTLYTPQY